MSAKKEELLNELRTKRVGLVLCGGGFKGAYQIGVWRALRKAGITRFHCIAGTSIGAINAILIAKGDIKSAMRMWREASIMRWSPRKLRTLVLAHFLLFGPLCGGLTALVAFGVSALANGPWYVLLGLSAMCATMNMVNVLLLALASVRRKILLYGDHYVHLAIGGALSLATAMGMKQGWPLLGIPLGLICALWGYDCLTTAQRKGRLLSNVDLLRNLRIEVKLDSIRANVHSLFVTTARGCTLVDPFRLNTRLRSFGGDAPREEIDTDSPGLHPNWVPEYHDLCQARTDAEAIELIRLTSALPFAFPTGVSSSDEWIVDGGVADNTPILPVLKTGVDYLIIVFLDRKAGMRARDWGFLQTHVNATYEKYVLPRLSSDEASAIYRQVVRRFAGYGRHDLFPAYTKLSKVKVIVLAPNRPLPICNLPVLKLVTGTLNFCIPTRRRWLAQGFRETQNKLQGRDEDFFTFMSWPAVDWA